MLSYFYQPVATNQPSLEEVFALYKKQSNKHDLSIFSQFTMEDFQKIIGAKEKSSEDLADLCIVALRMHPKIIFNLVEHPGFKSIYDKLCPFIDGKQLSQNQTLLFYVKKFCLLIKILGSELDIDINHYGSNNALFLTHYLFYYCNKINLSQMKELLPLLKKRNYDFNHVDKLGRTIFSVIKKNEKNLHTCYHILLTLLALPKIDASIDVMWLRIFIKKSQKDYEAKFYLVALTKFILSRENWREIMINIFNKYILEYFSAEEDLFDLFSIIRQLDVDKAGDILPNSRPDILLNSSEIKLVNSLFNMTKLYDAMKYSI